VHPLIASFRALGLKAAETPAGPVCLCPKCDAALDLVGVTATCSSRDCGWAASGEPWEVAQLASTARKPTAKATSGLPLIKWGADLRTKPEIPGELIPGILHVGAKMVLGGGSKSFKTWCLADLAMSLAAGCTWWNIKVEPTRVVYLNLEVSDPFFQERMQSIAEAKGIEIPDSLGVWNLRGRCADHRTLLPEIQHHLAGERLGAIFIDPLYKLMTGSENAQEEVAALMNSIEQLGEATGAATIFGAHFAKGWAGGKEAIDRISGSGVFARDPDAILTLTRHSEDDVFVVDSILRNCPPIAPFTLKWGYPLMRPWNADPSDIRQPGQPKKQAKEKVVTPEDVRAVLVEHGKPIMEMVHSRDGLNALLRSKFGIGRNAAQTALRAAVKAGKVQYLGSLQSPDKQYIPAP